MKNKQRFLIIGLIGLGFIEIFMGLIIYIKTGTFSQKMIDFAILTGVVLGIGGVFIFSTQPIEKLLKIALILHPGFALILSGISLSIFKIGESLNINWLVKLAWLMVFLIGGSYIMHLYFTSLYFVKNRRHGRIESKKK